VTLEETVKVPGPRCPFCHEEVPRGLRPEVCAACHALHHPECLAEHGACAGCGTPARPQDASDSDPASGGLAFTAFVREPGKIEEQRTVRAPSLDEAIRALEADGATVVRIGLEDTPPLTLFRYRAVDDAGARVHGHVTACDRDEAHLRIRGLGLFPTSIRSAGVSSLFGALRLREEQRVIAVVVALGLLSSLLAVAAVLLIELLRGG